MLTNFYIPFIELIDVIPSTMKLLQRLVLRKQMGKEENQSQSNVNYSPGKNLFSG